MLALVRAVTALAVAGTAAAALVGAHDVAASGWRSAEAPIATAGCESAIYVDPPPFPRRHDRVLFGRVWVPGRDRVAAPNPEPSGRGRFRYFAKTAIGVRRGSTALVEVPAAWRDRVAIQWGDSGVASRIRVAACRRGEEAWFAYTGGFLFTTAGGACVPLRVTVGAKTALVRFAVGRPC